MLKRLLLSALFAGLISGAAQSQADIVPAASMAPGAPAISIAPFTTSSLNSIFDGGSGQRFNVKSFLGASNGFAAKNKSAGKQASLTAKAAAFAENARRLFGNPRVFTRRGQGRVLANGAPSDGELNDEVRMSPKENAERERVIRELFLQAGARAEDIRVQDIGRGKHNFIVVKPGRTDRIIVVGGHHDKVSAGQGTIDNWTGATMVANLYQQLRDQDTEHTYVFIAFGREEEGLLGSEAYVRGLNRGDLSKIDNMVNLDTLGVDGTYSWKNNSDANLLQEFREVADREKLDLTEMYLDGGDADSSSFRKAGVRAITIFGASPDVIFDIIHSSRDNFGVFNLKHYVNSFELTAAALLSLDKKPSPGLSARLH